MTDHGQQGPTSGEKAHSLGQLFAIITHPAFRLGFLDAQHGRPFDHDQIDRRIRAETPPSYFKRQMGTLFEDRNVELAQYRYEEGRIVVLEHGLRCRAWGHPDFPPARLREFVIDLARINLEMAQPTAGDARVVEQLRNTLPLFEVAA